MEKILDLRVWLALLVAVVPQFAKADVFFSDNFSNGSTINSVTPAGPTTNSASYQELTGALAYRPDPPTISPNDLKFGCDHTDSGTAEIQALFTSNAVTLAQIGDYIQLAITFTNTAGLKLSGADGYLGVGLYNSGGVPPIAGGTTNATANSTNLTTGGALLWQGYVGWIGSPNSSRIMTRSPQIETPLANNDQDVCQRGSSTYAYSSPAATTIGHSESSNVVFTVGGTYTEVLTMTLNGTNNLGGNSVAITNTIYAGGTNGTFLTQIGGVATNTTFLVSSFDALAIGWYQKTDLGTGTSNTIDISSITVSGQVTPTTNGPIIVSQPVPATAPTNTLVPFVVVASGNNLTYQWHRNGTNLVDGSSISGADSSTLLVSPTTAADFASGTNDYYCTVSNSLGSVDSTKVSLTSGTAKNLVWSGSSDVWDLNTTASWLNGASAATFNYGDNVTFNGNGNVVTLTGQYLSAGSVTVTSSAGYDFTGSGSIAGPGKLFYVGDGILQIENANTYTGGTIISNALAYLYLNNLNGLGSGPITLAKAGGIMEIVPTGNSSHGLRGDIIVADDFTINYQGSGSYSAVFFGNLSGTSGKTLTVNYDGGGSDVTRVRLYGNNTVYDGNLALPNSLTLWADYGDSQAFNGVISGSGAFMQKGSISYLNGANTYSGGTYPVDGAIGLGSGSCLGTGPVLLTVDSTSKTTGTGQLFAYGGARTVANPIQYVSGTNNLTLVIGGANNLTLSGAFTLNGNDNITTNTFTSRTVEVTNTALTTLSGVISDNGLGYGFNKTGDGLLALSANETYTGPTIVGGGTLLVNGSLNASSSVTVTNGLLGGSGTVNGAVTATDGGVAPGNNGIGTLTINNSLTLQAGSSNVFEVNKTMGTHDLMNVSGAVTYGGTLYATNLSGTLAVGNSFTIFSAGSETGDFSTVAGSPGPGLAWSFDPTNGVLSVVTGVATNSTNITVTVVTNISGGKNVQLSWPQDHLGWTLQTNAVGLASTTNWFDYPGSASVTNESIPIDLTKTNVFYRLMYNP